MKKLGIYIHIPFCKERCNYCDFLSFSHVEYHIDKYMDCLLKEIYLLKGEYGDYEVDSIYLGGGTPSFLKEGYVSKILGEIRENFTISQNPEISIEINPNTLTEGKIKEYKGAGINRISLAIQTFDNEKLKLLGRDHNMDIILEDYRALREYSFDNISFDLIMAIPGQDLSHIEKDLSYIKKLKPDHVSYYSLILEEKTFFNKWLREGKISLVDEDLERDMYDLVNKRLLEFSYNRYEISNFSRPNMESRHNLKYWNIDDYLGIGLGSASYMGGRRFSNTRSFKKYISEIDKGILPRENYEDLTNMDMYEEYIMLKSRINGLDILEIKEKFSIDILEYRKEEIKRLEDLGLIRILNNLINIESRGLDVLNRIILSLI